MNLDFVENFSCQFWSQRAAAVNIPYFRLISLKKRKQSKLKINMYQNFSYLLIKFYDMPYFKEWIVISYCINGNSFNFCYFYFKDK